MRNLFALTLTVPALAVAVPALAQAADPAAKAAAKTYVTKAGAGDLYEIQSSQLVLTSTQDPKLRDYANMMVRDHTKSTADVKAAAQAAGMKAAQARLDGTGTRNMAALRRAKGTARDQLYLQQQKASHQTALQVQQDYAANGTVEPLKAAAGTIVPVVQHHVEMVDGMASGTPTTM